MEKLEGGVQELNVVEVELEGGRRLTGCEAVTDVRWMLCFTPTDEALGALTSVTAVTEVLMSKCIRRTDSFSLLLHLIRLKCVKFNQSGR